MATEYLQPAFGFAAGALTILSPCVLPLVPVVLGSAAQLHRFGPAALAGGLIASFASVGFLLAAFGSQLSVDPGEIRLAGAIIMGVAGGFLLTGRFQDRVAVLASPMVAWAGTQQQRLETRGLWGQAAIGALLGIVWSPCVGPTLGAAIAVAAQGQQLSVAAITMTAFACGIAASLLALALIGRALVGRLRGGIATSAKAAKTILGATLLGVSVMIITGIDRAAEAAFLSLAPDWLVTATTSW